MGGEEFLIVCPETNERDAAKLAEHLRHRIETSSPDTGLNHTASFGVTQVRPSDTAKEIFIRADDALYEAKKTGRNRVVIYKESSAVVLENSGVIKTSQ